MIEVREAEGQGRGYFAKETGIRAGTTVLEDTAVVSVVKDGQEDRTCRRCFQPCTPAEISASRCPRCGRSVLCFECAAATTAATAPTTAPAISTNPRNRRESPPPLRRSHDPLECESLERLSSLEGVEPDLAGRLLGNTTVYVRMLLRLLAMRAEERRRPCARGGRDGSEGTEGGGGAGDHSSIYFSVKPLVKVTLRRGKTRQDKTRHDTVTTTHAQAGCTGTLNDVDELEDHLEDLLDGGEMEARLANTARACKLVAPTAWKANQNTCAEFLGKLYCNSMTIGRIGISAPHARRGYWSGIRGCLYSDFGVGLFPGGAMFNHSCAPNCAWLTDLPSGKLRVVAVQDVPPGSQLFISYVDILQPGPTRRGFLMEHFFFDCACRRCLGPRSLRCGVRLRRRHHRPTAPPPPPLPSSQAGNPLSPSPSSSCFSPEEDLVSGGWICPKRSCCGKGTVLPTGGDRRRIEGEAGGGNGGGSSGGGGGEVVRCVSCRGITGEAYFDRWTELLGVRLTSADLDLERGRVAEGRVKLGALMILCEKRLSSTNSFALGVCSRLMLAAAVDGDWEQTAAFAERTLQCLRALRFENYTRSSETDSTRAASGDPLPSTAIWKAVVMEVLDRALSLAGCKGNSETDSHMAGVEMAERASALWGLRRASLVEL